MKQPYNQKNTFLLWLVLLIIGLLVFKYTSNSIIDQTLSYNNFFKPLPKPYERFVENKAKPIDVIFDWKEIKFNAHISENGLYREVVLVKKVTASDSRLEPIHVDVYPTNSEQLNRKHITYTTNSIMYSYKGENFCVARQVLPNIELTKIVTYTKNWQTTIAPVDNSTLSSKDTPHLKTIEHNKTDSLAIGIDTKNSPYDFLFGKALEDHSIFYLSKKKNFTNNDILKESEVFKSYLNEKELRLLYIQNDISFWKKLTQQKQIPVMKFLSLNKKIAQTKLNAYISGNVVFADVFDIEKLAAYYALLNLYSNRTENSLYLNLNETTGLLEPYFVEKPLGKLNTYVKDLKIHNINFSKQYVEQLTRFATLIATNERIEVHQGELKKILEIIHQSQPLAIFDSKLFEHNKLIIEKALNPSTTTKIALVSYTIKQMEVEVENLTSFPIEIAELSYKKKKFIISPSGESSVVMPSEKSIVIFALPDSYDNLFVQKKKKTAGFIFEKDIFNLFLGYRLTGTNAMKYNSITPFVDFDALSQEDDLFRTKSDLSSFEFIAIDEVNKEIRFTMDAIVLNKPLLFPKGYIIHAEPGLQIDIVAGGKIISKSPVHFVGTATHPIKIYSSDGKGQGLFVVSAKKTSELKYVEFDKLTNQSHGLWDITGAVVFYESPVDLNHVLIANNSCEDGLNIIRTTFTMSNTSFKNTQSDAFDGDFVQGTLTDCTFENIGNDAIDVSGSKLELYNLTIVKAGDKALSAGEDSQMTGSNIKIDSSEIAIAGKDLSIVNLTDISISNTKLGFTAFQKKPEFGASDIIAKNVVMTQVETPYLIENKSSLRLNDKQTETIDAVKEQMYGVEFGVDSKETRVKKQ